MRFVAANNAFPYLHATSVKPTDATTIAFQHCQRCLPAIFSSLPSVFSLTLRWSLGWSVVGRRSEARCGSLDMTPWYNLLLPLLAITGAIFE